jgi:lysylphosphatidylglycerol synthetase-like protein (DUF2156 family)
VGTEYFFAIGNEQRGPHTLEELRGVGLRPDTLVWYDGLPEWKRADALPELAPLLAAPQPVGVRPVQVPMPTAALSYQQPNLALRTNGMAIASLVFGILSIPTTLCKGFGIILAVLAITFGSVARGQIKRGQGQGLGIAKAGIICGLVPIGLIAAAFFVAFIYFLIHPAAPITSPP